MLTEAVMSSIVSDSHQQLFTDMQNFQYFRDGSRIIIVFAQSGHITNPIIVG